MSDDLHLSDAADTFDVPSGDIDAVVTRARSRTKRRRAALATVTTIAVVAGAVSLIGTRGDGNPGPGRVLASGNAPGRIGDAGLTWARADHATALGMVPSVAGDGPLYALSTGPGETDYAKARQKGTLWRSSDGVDWKSVSRLGNDLFLADLAPSGDRIYGVGTGPATAAVAGRRRVPSLVAGWSDDGGRTWTKADLPVDVAAVAAKTTSSGVGDTQVAASDKGTLAVAVLRGSLDVRAVLPAGATAPNGWAITDTGVDVLGPRKDNVCPAGTTAEKGGVPVPAPSRPVDEVAPTYCFKGNPSDPSGGRVGPDAMTVVSPQDANGVTARYTWDQLGVSGDLLQAVRSEPIAFFAPAGSTGFERVELPAGSAGSPTIVEADADGFDLVVSPRGDPTKPSSTSTVSIFHSADGRQWAPGQLQQGVAWLNAAGRLGGRTALIGDGDNGPVLLTKADGGGWAITPLGNLAGHGADTKLVLGAAAVGPAGAGVVLMEVPDESKATVNPNDRWQPVNHLVVSRDGKTWQEQSLDDIAGTKTTGVGSIYVTASHIVVSATLPKANDNDPTAPRVTLVGTPR